MREKAKTYFYGRHRPSILLKIFFIISEGFLTILLKYDYS